MAKAWGWKASALLLLAAGGCAPEPSKGERRAEGKQERAEAPLVPRPDIEGPFGITLGAPVDSVPGLTRGEEAGQFTTRTPPEPHADFEQVVVIGYPGVGICTVRGIGRTFDNDAAGSTIRASIDGLAEALATKYGPPERLNFCNGGDIQCENQFWMMTLLQGQRTYGARWERANETMRRAHIGSIYLIASAPSISSSAPLLEYRSSNDDACAAAERRQRASAL